MAKKRAEDRRGEWRTVLIRYFVLIILTNLIWETGQLPFYTIWREGSTKDIVIAILHCTAGDVVIASNALVLAIVFVGDRRWPELGFRRVLLSAVCFGVLYTVYSEWFNVIYRKTWAYSDSMITVPWIGTGLAPLAQWLVLPPLCLLLARRRSLRSGDGMEG